MDLPWNMRYSYTLPETNEYAPENQWLEDDISFWDPVYFQGRTVSFREGKKHVTTISPANSPTTVDGWNPAPVYR